MSGMRDAFRSLSWLCAFVAIGLGLVVSWLAVPRSSASMTPEQFLLEQAARKRLTVAETAASKNWLWVSHAQNEEVAKAREALNSLLEAAEETQRAAESASDRWTGSQIACTLIALIVTFALVRGVWYISRSCRRPKQIVPKQSCVKSSRTDDGACSPTFGDCGRGSRDRVYSFGDRSSDDSEQCASARSAERAKEVTESSPRIAATAGDCQTANEEKKHVRSVGVQANTMDKHPLAEKLALLRKEKQDLQKLRLKEKAKEVELEGIFEDRSHQLRVTRESLADLAKVRQMQESQISMQSRRLEKYSAQLQRARREFVSPAMGEQGEDHWSFAGSMEMSPAVACPDSSPNSRRNSTVPPINFQCFQRLHGHAADRGGGS